MTINGFGTGNWQPWETVIVNIPSNLSSGDANLLISLNGNPGVALTSASGGGPGQNNFTNDLTADLINILARHWLGSNARVLL